MCIGVFIVVCSRRFGSSVCSSVFSMCVYSGECSGVFSGMCIGMSSAVCRGMFSGCVVVCVVVCEVVC